MDLESRVAAVEIDLATIRDEQLPSLRTETERKYHDLRVETHGWAEVAIKAGNKVDNASEIINLICTEVRETREEVRATRVEIGEIRSEIGQARTELREEIAEVRTELDQKINMVRIELKEEIGQVRTVLSQQGETLQKILAKLS